MYVWPFVPKFWGSSLILVTAREDPAGPEIGAVERSVVGSGEHKGLEDGSSRALSEGVVQLRVAVVAATDEGQDLAGVWIECHQGDLRIRDVPVRRIVRC